MLFPSAIPIAALQPFVHDYWLYDGYSGPHPKERILPSGTIELVVNLLEDEIRIYDPVSPHGFQRFSGCLVSGAFSRPFITDMVQERSMMGVHFRPGGAFPFLGENPETLADRHVDLQTLWGSDAVELRERLCAADHALQRIEIMERALLAHQFRSLNQHSAVAAIVHRADGESEHVLVRDSAAEIGLSQRTFIRAFAEQVGVTPKRFLRLQRLQRAMNAAEMASPAPDWARIAYSCGYSDQSHMINDFRRFSCLSPRQ